MTAGRSYHNRPETKTTPVPNSASRPVLFCRSFQYITPFFLLVFFFYFSFSFSFSLSLLLASDGLVATTLKKYNIAPSQFCTMMGFVLENEIW